MIILKFLLYKLIGNNINILFIIYDLSFIYIQSSIFKVYILVFIFNKSLKTFIIIIIT